MRGGKGPEVTIPRSDGRITPACAGKRPHSCRKVYAVRDHPRVRGEKLDGRPAGPDRIGSPPRARGKGQRAGLDGGQPGITPACAGKRGVVLRHRPECRDHPRVRGEKSPPLVSCFATWGSPPRARGKDCPGSPVPRPLRITPACAGKSTVSDTPHPELGDHPRVRGEKGWCFCRWSVW